MKKARVAPSNVPIVVIALAPGLLLAIEVGRRARIAASAARASA
jgi:hypothetical protein